MLVSKKFLRPQTFRAFSSAPKWENVLYEEKEGGVALIQLNRPKSLNALCDALFHDLNEAVNHAEKDDKIGCMVLTGNSPKAFAAGADIKEMAVKEFPQTYSIDMLSWWENVARARKPIVGAINGFALGGGCELAMMLDILIASEKAKFGQPEITLATIPGMGGSQRLVKAIGKSRAMELILTGEFMDAQEAKERNLVSRVVPHEELIPEALKTAQKIASFSRPISMMCKEVVNKSFETTLATGLDYERRVFHSTFGVADRKEGMTAFAEKRKPEWQHK